MGKVATNAGYIWRWSDNTAPVVPIMKYIAAVDPETNKIVEVFRTKTAAHILGGYNVSTIGRCCKSPTATHKGLRWCKIGPEGIPDDIDPGKLHLEFTYSGTHVV